MTWCLELEKVIARWAGGDYVFGAFADEGRPAPHIVQVEMGKRLVIGRAPSCDIFVPVVRVNRNHCWIWRDEGGVWVRDLNSRNGTFVSGTQLLGGPQGEPGPPVPVRLDDVVHLARSEFAVVLTARFAVPPHWRDFQGGLISHLARGIASEHRVEDLPILADALEDAGCDLPELLLHLRDRHLRTQRCWVAKRLLRGLAAGPGDNA
jgi:hypothetical protein